MSTLWSADITAIGPDASDMIDGGVVILFGEPVPEALAEVDGLVGLPMLGEKASINVGNAAAAILYAVAATTQYGVKL